MAKVAAQDREDEGYSRISDDPYERELGVERQEDGGDAMRRNMGLPPVTTWHRENDVSASEYSDKPRPKFSLILNRVRTGKVRSITAYSQERITRRPDEWMLFSGLCVANDVKVYLENRGGLIDITSATGKLTSGLFSLLAQYESALISERVRNANEQRRSTLLLPSPTSVRAFGFKHDGFTHIPHEAGAIQAAAPVLLRQQSVSAVRRFFVENDVKPVKVELWSTPSLRAVFLRPRVAGLIEHKGEIVGEGDPNKVFPILERPEWEACCEVLSIKTPRGPGATARKHLLSGFLICGKCAHKMVVRGHETGRNARYGCPKDRGGCGSVMRSMSMVDPWVDDFMRAYLDAHAGDPVAEDLGGAEAELADQLTDLQDRVAFLDHQKDAGHLELVDWVRGLQPLREEIKKVRAQQVKARKARAAAEGTMLDEREVWRSGTLEQRRALLRAATGGFLVKPVGRVGSRGAPPDSIEVLPPVTALQ